MTEPTERPDHLEFCYSRVTDWYDIDHYAHERTLDRLGIPSARLRDESNADINYMEVYNEARGHVSKKTAARWLSVFTRPSFWLVFWFAQLVIAMAVR